MVQTRAQSKTTPASSAAGEKPPARRSAKSVTTASIEKTKSNSTKSDEPKATRTRTTKALDPVKPEIKSVRKTATKPPTKAEPKEPLTKTQVPKSKTVPKAAAPSKKSESDLKKSTARNPKLGKPIKPKTKAAITARKRDDPNNKHSEELTEKPLLLQSPTRSNATDIADGPDLKQQENAQIEGSIPTGKNIKPVELAPPTPNVAIFKSSILSPTKSLGSPIKPPVSTRPNRTLDSPKRGSPLKITSLRKDPVERTFVQGADLPVANSSAASSFKTTGLSPFKSIGTPIRRAFTSNLFSSKLSATATAPKRFATESPWRPMSAQGEKKLKLASTPQRPRSADEFQIPNSCLRDVSRAISAKKSVSFHSPGEGDGSPERSKHVSKFVLAAPSLPRVSEGQEPESSPEPEPLPLSEVLNMEFSPETAQTEPQNPSILKNVTFYVDIWGSDGSCANQYFMPLLEELGAKISVEWTDDITHVLFKDGDARTLKRVAQSRGAIKCVNVGWALDCERYQSHMPEDPYSIICSAEPNTPGQTLRTPLRLLSTNKLSPTPRLLAAKTPGTIKKFDARIQALREERIKTPDLSSIQMDNDVENMQSPDSEPTPLMQKSCPAKQANEPLYMIDGNAEVRKKLFKGARKSLGAALMMKWVDEDNC